MRSRAHLTGTLPQTKAQTLIVVQAFKRNRDGEIVPAVEPREMPDERRAIARAKELSLEHAGAIAWKRDANPDEGEFGEPVVIYSRGELPDLDMPVRKDEPDDATPDYKDGDGDGQLPWKRIRLHAARDWKPFRDAFHALYNQHEDKDSLALFTALQDRRIVVLPPEAARLVEREMPSYPLTACERPPTEMMSLELGHSLQLDTTWFSASPAERETRRAAVRLSPEDIEAEDDYYLEIWGMDLRPKALR